MKECTKCKQLKSLTEYCKRSQSKDDGLARYCRECMNTIYKVYWKTIALKESEKRNARKQQLRANLQDNQHNQPQILHWEEMSEQGESMGQVLGFKQRINSGY